MVKLALEGLDVVDGLQDDLELGQLLRLLSPLLGQQEPQLLDIPRTQLLGPPDVLQLAEVHGLLHHRHRCRLNSTDRYQQDRCRRTSAE